MTQPQKLALFLGLPAVLCCAGSLALVSWGLKTYRTEVCAHLGEFEQVTASTGTPFTRCEIDIGGSLALEDTDTFMFTFAGPNGSGRAWVKSTTDGDGNEVYQGLLAEIGGNQVLLQGERPATK